MTTPITIQERLLVGFIILACLSWPVTVSTWSELPNVGKVFGVQDTKLTRAETFATLSLDHKNIITATNQMYSTTENTVVYRNNRSTQLINLQPGDKLTLSLDSDGSVLTLFALGPQSNLDR
ncbi:hypothetical protein HGA91_00020 [candidate division WWE3 bacterium]|nr:hypothetical protein [candidate division WWE3 bacterium]